MSDISQSQHEYKTLENTAADAYREYLDNRHNDFYLRVQQDAEDARQKLRRKAFLMALKQLGISEEEHYRSSTARRAQARRYATRRRHSPYRTTE